MNTVNELSEKALAYVPDRILVRLKTTRELSVQRIEKLCGAVLFLDMVGFTSLTEELVEKNLSSDRNIELLQETLTEYFNEMLSVIRKYGGFAYQFAGDSVMVGMVCEENESLEMCAIRAAKSAIETQRSVEILNNSKTDLNDIKINIKISLSIGEYFQIALGSSDQLINSTIIGAPVDDAVRGEKLAAGGDVIVSKILWQSLPENKVGEPVESFGMVSGAEYFRLTSLISENHILFDASMFDMANLETRIYKICSRFIPDVLFKKIMGGNKNSIGDFRDVTSFFVSFSQDNSKEIKERVSVTNRFFEYIHLTSLAYGGTLVQIDFTDKGNVFLILFGAPQGLENKEIMATRFALKLKNEQEKFPDITGIKIGIATGKSYCGDLGAEFRKGYTVVSKSVNLAARLMTYDNVNLDKTVIHIDTATLNGLTTNFKSEFVESGNLKGIKEIINIYRLLEEKEIKRELNELYAEPMIGREIDLEVLNNSLNEVIKGKMMVMSISGEVGVGKTRLMAAFLENIKKATNVTFTSVCYPYERFSPYFPWKELLSKVLNIHELDDDGLKIEQIENVINSMDGVDIQWVRTLARFIGINTEESVLTKNLELKQKKERIFQIILNLFKMECKIHPVILVFEDVHWIDEASLELLEYVMQNMVNDCVMIILVYRSGEEFDVSIKKLNFGDHNRQIILHELDEDDAMLLIQQNLKLVETNQGLEKKIFVNSRGNPFFIESIIHNLKENNILVENENGNNIIAKNIRDMEIPKQLNDVIMARIDRLGENEQIILKSASVIGSVFLLNLLHKLVPAIEYGALFNRVSLLQQLDITSMESENPLTYIFRHVAIRDVVYNSMLISTRRNIHLQLAGILEEENVNNLGRVAGALSYHFNEGENHEKAYFYALIAARWAAEQFANHDAIHYYEQALKILDLNSNIEDRKGQVFQIKEEMAGVCRIAGEFELARYLYAECFDFYNIPIRQAKLYLGMGQLFQEQGDNANSIKYMEQALKLLGANVPGGKFSTIGALLWQIILRGVHIVFPFFIRRIKKNTELYLLRSRIFMVLAKIYFFKSPESTAWCAFAHANLAERTGSKYDLCLAYSNYATILEGLGMQKVAVKYYERSMEIVKTSNFQYAEGLILQRYGLHGLCQNDLDFVVSCEQKSIYIFKQIGELWEVLTSLILCALSRMFSGNFSEALVELHEMKKICIKVNSKMQLGWAQVRISYLDYILGARNYNEVKGELELSLTLAKETDDLSGISSVYALHANVLTLEGVHEKAVEMAEKAYNEILKYRIKMPQILYGFVYVCETAFLAVKSDTYVQKKRAMKLFLRSYKSLKRGSFQFKYLLGPAFRMKALMFKLHGHIQKAQVEIEYALKHLKSSPNQLELALALMNAGYIYSDEKYIAEAKIIFEKCNVKKYY
jgi:adenylate cyclase